MHLHFYYTFFNKQQRANADALLIMGVRVVYLVQLYFEIWPSNCTIYSSNV
uniref:Uncharacterized protein n=1 Tax=Arundo donax TaxID=35708 RepID=A0A0A8ZTM4_ARUDO